MKKILIIQTAFIGDVILATSLIESTKNAYPQAQIDFLLRKGNESLLGVNPHLNQVLIWNKKEGKIRGLLKLLREIRANKYDAVMVVQRFFNAGLLAGLSGAKRIVGFHSNPLSFLFTDKIIHKIPHPTDSGFFHEVQRNHQLLSALTKEEVPNASEIPPKLYFNQKHHDKIKSLDLSEPYFVLAPSSVWFTKQWQKSKWVELIEKLNTAGTIVLIGGPDDKEYLDSLGGEVINLAGKLNLVDSALLMKNAKRVFVNDSAPLHLASSVNAKTTAIFCSTVPDFGYTPLSTDNVLIQRERLDCMPCGLHGKKACPLGHFKCSEDIAVDDVIQKSFEK